MNAPGPICQQGFRLDRFLSPSRPVVLLPVRRGISKRVSRYNTQTVCPFNNDRFVQLTGERDYRPDWRVAEDRPGVPTDLPATDSPSLVELMRMTPEEWDLWTRGSAIRRAGYAGFKRNVAVALGNWLVSVDDPPEEAMAVLRDALEDGEPVVGEHAAWALKPLALPRRSGP